MLRYAARLLIVLMAWSGSAAPAAAQDRSTHVAGRQAPLTSAQRRIDASLQAAIRIAMQAQGPMADTPATRAFGVDPDGNVEVYIYLDRLSLTVLTTIQQHGAQLHYVHQAVGMVHATVNLDNLETIAALPFVRWIRAPLPGVLRTGSVTSLGDEVLGAAEARQTFGIDGNGVQVGIISDSLINLSSSVNSGDLTDDVIIVDDSNGSHLVNPTDEGRAMAEIIHDLAPGATLHFHSGFPTPSSIMSSSNMVRAIAALVASGVDIIVDDIGFFDEPVFEDGIVAQAVQNAIANDVVYVTAAGNDAERHYRGVYVDSNPADPDENFHDFGGGDITLNVNILPRNTMIAVLQWPNSFDGSGHTADYDLMVRDETGSTDACSLVPAADNVCLSANDQMGIRAPPLETVRFTNNSSTTVTVTVLVTRVSGEALPLDLHFNREAQLLEHAVPEASLFGHPCVVDALAVGAIHVNDPGFDTIERFSSRGPCQIFFPVAETRAKPDLVAADGVNTSMPGFRPFSGTSASAPHVAAIAALLIEAAGGPGKVSASEIVSALRRSAVDLGLPGVDPVYGHGAVDAVEALSTLFALPGNRPGKGDSGGGGGCDIMPADLTPASPLLAALGNIFLPIMAIGVIRTWRRHRSGREVIGYRAKTHHTRG